MKVIKTKKVLGAIPPLLLCIAIIFNTTMVNAAATKTTLSENDYPLYVEEYPDNIYNEIFAKFKTAKSNTDEYYLNLSSEESGSVFTAALKKSKVAYNEDFIAHFNPALYKMTDDEDKKVTDAVEVFIPIPDDAQDHPEDCSFFQVSGGSAKLQNTQLYVTPDSVYYIKLALSTYTTYGFVYQDPDSYESDEEDDEDEDDEENDDEEDDEEDETPVKKKNDPDSDSSSKKTDSGSTVTVDANGKKIFTSGSDDTKSSSSSKDAKSSSTSKDTKPKASPTPTPKPTKSATATDASKTSQKSSTTNPIPKTGDEFPVKPLSIIILVTVVILITTASILISRKRDQLKKNL